MMNNVYRGYWSLVQNYYCPQQKLISKQRIGSKIVRKMGNPQTPYERLKTFLCPEEIHKMELQKKSSNPILAMHRLKKAARNIFGYFKDSIKKQERGKILI